MNRVPLFASLLCLVLGLPVAAQTAPGSEVLAGFLPLEQLPAARVRWRPFRERVHRLGRSLRVLPPLRGLLPPTRGELRLAVLLVSFPDQPPPAFGPEAWEAALFSRGSYRRTASGEPAQGSMRDYFWENSSGALDVRGRVFDWVQVPTRRADLEGALSPDPRARQRLFAQALRALRAREGRDVLRAFDALAFVVAGGRAAARGSVLWPHSALLTDGARPWRYYLMHAGTQRFEPIGVHCHELGHVLGILDKYGIGSGTGLGQWCLMASGGHGARRRGVALDAPKVDFWDRARDLVRERVDALRKRLRPRRQAPRLLGNARPLHLCAVCKERLGWTRPVVLDPRRPARFYLEPVEGDASQVVRVLLDPNGLETLYLELRAQEGFDAQLPAAGLLAWRVGSPSALVRTGVPFEGVELLPAHGVRSLDTALRAPARVPFPTGGVDRLVARGTLPGSWTVELRGIRRVERRLYLELQRVD